MLEPNTRRSGAVLLISSIVMLGMVLLFSPPERALYTRAARVTPEFLAGLYALLIAISALLFVFHRRVERLLAAGPGAVGACLAAALLSAAIPLMIQPDQLLRLFGFPLTLWLAILHLVAACALIVWTAAHHLNETARRQATRAVLLVLALLLIGLAGSYALSVGEFMGFDLPDEPWFSSAAQHYAETGSLAPAFLAFTNGDPDPQMPAYYLSMGLWLRAAGFSLVNLRLFPLFVAGIGLALFALALRKIDTLTQAQRLIALVALLSLSAVVRTSHNLRPDILMIVQGVAVVWGFCAYWQTRSRWALVIMGAALLPSLESIIAVGLFFGAVIGLVLIMRAVREKTGRDVAIYTAACAAACLLYLGVHFLPDVTTTWANFQAGLNTYTSERLFGFIPLQEYLSWMTTYLARFSISFSPIELIAVLAASAGLMRYGQRWERWLTTVIAICVLLMPLILRFNHAYFVLFAPFAAYALARAGANERASLAVALAILPGMAVTAINDMNAAALKGENTRLLAEIMPVSDAIPEDTVVIAEDLFFFTLEPSRQFISWYGLQRYTARYGIEQEEALRRLRVDALLCAESQPDHCAIGDRLGISPQVMAAGGQVYRIYTLAPEP